MSQEERIKNHLIMWHTLTAIEALNLFGCFRLSARIYDLRQSGFEVESETIDMNGKRIARYHAKQYRRDVKRKNNER